MHLYKIDPKTSFIAAVANFITENFSDLSALKVILPTGYACLELQRILVKRSNAMILPNICQFNKTSGESADVFRIPTEIIEAVSYLENKIMLAEIINSYQELDYDLVQSLKLSPVLADLFYKFTINNLDIKDLDELPTHSAAQHWQFIYKFLIYAKTELNTKTANIRKTDQASWFKNMLLLEIDRLKSNENNKLLIAGIFGSDLMSWQFLAKAAEGGAHIILPPLPFISEKSIEKTLKPEDGLYCLKQLLRLLNCKIDDFKNLNRIDSSANKLIYNYDRLITNTEHKKSSSLDNLIYIEFENIFDEAKHVAQFCKKVITENANAKIAIIINNKNIKQFYTNYLNNYNIPQCNLLGEESTSSNVYQLIISISKIMCSSFEFSKLLQMLKNPFVLCSEVFVLEKFLRKTKKPINNWLQLISIAKTYEDKKFITWITNIESLINIKIGSEFNELLKQVLIIAEHLAPDLWSYEESGKIAEMFRELVKLNWTKTLIDKTSFPNILEELIAGSYFIRDKSCPAEVTIGTHQELALIKFDYLILADFNEGNWPRSINKSPWLNRQMQQQLNFYDQQIGASLSLYNFYLMLFNKQVLITRAKKQNNIDAAESSYLLKLKYITDDLFKKSDDTTNICNIVNNLLTNVESAQVVSTLNNDIELKEHNLFPEQISATDIEMLVRGPYSFYAKKILNLRVLDNITSGQTLADFGNFVHNVIDKYSKNYCQKRDKLEHLIEICDDYLQENSISKINNWRIKFKQIAAEFIEFDEERRRDNYIYSEIFGEMIIDVASKKIKIIAIADRIEIDRQGRATILDFKTGSVPTKKDVMHGLSPQLIIEAMILNRGGFLGINTKIMPKIVYVKIASSKPYLKLTEIEFDEEDLNQHLEGITKLLEYYLVNKNFTKELDLLKYNNYKHLSRSL